jgi:hypothetical protein
LTAVPRRLICINCAFKEHVFGCLNIRSLHNKLDDFLEVRCQCLLDAVCLSETWHDADSVCVRRLRASGYQVVDRPRPSPSSEIGTAGTNHGDVLVAAVPGTHLSSVASATVAITAAATFEAVCVRVSTGSFNCIVLVICRSGSEAVTASFFDELADVLGRPECWQRLYLDEMAALYDSELTAIADRLLPARIMVCRQ